MTIDNNVYRKAERYARLHNTSVEHLVEHTIISYINLEPTVSSPVKTFRETDEFKNAMDIMESLVADDLDSPVPADEDGRGCRTKKYML